jgi:hypothetical protein
MGKPRRFGDLEIGYDPAHEEREWIGQRTGWGLMACVSAAAILGLAGGGPLSRMKSGSVAAPLQVEYQRYVRHGAPATLKVYVNSAARQNFSLGFERSYIERFKVEEVMPQPLETRLAGQHCLFRFAGSGERQLVTFRFEPEQLGSASTRLMLDEENGIEITQFCLP